MLYHTCVNAVNMLLWDMCACVFTLEWCTSLVYKYCVYFLFSVSRSIWILLTVILKSCNDKEMIIIALQRWVVVTCTWTVEVHVQVVVGSCINFTVVLTLLLNVCFYLLSFQVRLKALEVLNNSHSVSGRIMHFSVNDLTRMLAFESKEEVHIT